MARSAEYLAAEAALDGRSQSHRTMTATNVPLELKLCEMCPRLFVREVGSKDKYCAECRKPHRATPFKGDVLRFFELRHKRGSRPYRRTCRAVARDQYFDRKKLRCLPPTS